MAEEIARHHTTKSKLSDVETNYASISDAMEKEKNCHKETIDKLAIEESNHMITQTKLTESKDKLVEEIAKQEDYKCCQSSVKCLLHSVLGDCQFVKMLYLFNNIYVAVICF